MKVGLRFLCLGSVVSIALSIAGFGIGAAGDDQVPRGQTCSDDAIRYLEACRKARIAELESSIKKTAARLHSGKSKGKSEKAQNKLRAEVIAKNKKTAHEIASLRDGTVVFIPVVQSVDELSVGDVGRFDATKFLVEHVIGGGEVEVRQIVGTMTTFSVGAEIRQRRGPDKIGSRVILSGINAAGLAAGGEMIPQGTFEVVGRVPVSGGGECLKLKSVFVSSLPPLSKKAAPAKHGKST